MVYVFERLRCTAAGCAAWTPAGCAAAGSQGCSPAWAPCSPAPCTRWEARRRAECSACAVAGWTHPASALVFLPCLQACTQSCCRRASWSSTSGCPYRSCSPASRPCAMPAGASCRWPSPPRPGRLACGQLQLGLTLLAPTGQQQACALCLVQGPCCGQGAEHQSGADQFCFVPTHFMPCSGSGLQWPQTQQPAARRRPLVQRCAAVAPGRAHRGPPLGAPRGALPGCQLRMAAAVSRASVDRSCAVRQRRASLPCSALLSSSTPAQPYRGHGIKPARGGGDGLPGQVR